MEKISKILSILGLFTGFASLLFPLYLLSLSASKKAGAGSVIAMSVVFIIVSLGSAIIAILSKSFAKKRKKYKLISFDMFISSLGLFVNSSFISMPILSQSLNYNEKNSFFISLGISFFIVLALFVIYKIAGKNNKIHKKSAKRTKNSNKKELAYR
ncbi:MAG: hypothetical protein KBT46_04650 [Ruminococcus sp.]|nr:hypothetical protein [Candidatus Copronaster equi]